MDFLAFTTRMLMILKYAAYIITNKTINFLGGGNIFAFDIFWKMDSKEIPQVNLAGYVYLQVGKPGKKKKKWKKNETWCKVTGVKEILIELDGWFSFCVIPFSPLFLHLPPSLFNIRYLFIFEEVSSIFQSFDNPIYGFPLTSSVSFCWITIRPILIWFSSRGRSRNGQKKVFEFSSKRARFQDRIK